MIPLQHRIVSVHEIDGTESDRNGPGWWGLDRWDVDLDCFLALAAASCLIDTRNPNKI